MSRGDTIIEVLISIIVLSQILTGAYTTSLNSRHQILEAQERNVAVGIAQSQVEDLRAEASNNPGLDDPMNATAGAYLAPTTNSFCYPPPGNTFTKNLFGNCSFPGPAGGSVGSYKVAILGICPSGTTCHSNADNQTNATNNIQTYSFSITVSWVGATNANSNVVLYYRVAL